MIAVIRRSLSAPNAKSRLTVADLSVQESTRLRITIGTFDDKLGGHYSAKPIPIPAKTTKSLRRGSLTSRPLELRPLFIIRLEQVPKLELLGERAKDRVVKMGKTL